MTGHGTDNPHDQCVNRSLNKRVKSLFSFSHDSTAGLMVLGLSTAGLAVLSGLTLLGFAAYQTLQYSNELKLTQQEFTGLPFTITAELLVAAGVTMWGSLLISGNFKPISALTNQKGLDASTLRSDFMVFNHRGSALPLNVQ